MIKHLTLIFIGCDSWERPVYECDGRLYVDTDPRSHRAPRICTKLNNMFDGEPDTPIDVIENYKDARIRFVPERAVWGNEREAK